MTEYENKLGYAIAILDELLESLSQGATLSPCNDITEACNTIARIYGVNPDDLITYYRDHYTPPFFAIGQVVYFENESLEIIRAKIISIEKSIFYPDKYEQSIATLQLSSGETIYKFIAQLSYTTQHNTEE